MAIAVNLKIKSLFRLFFQQKTCVFYAQSSTTSTASGNKNIKVYDCWSQVPDPYKNIISPSKLPDVMRLRLCTGKAKLLLYSEDDRSLDAYGWIQEWRPFRRKFFAISSSGMMLGPFWTAPSRRGQGIYGHLLRDSLDLCPVDTTAYIYTSPQNMSSQKGIMKAGFSYIGTWKLTQWLIVFSHLRKIDQA